MAPFAQMKFPTGIGWHIRRSYNTFVVLTVYDCEFLLLGGTRVHFIFFVHFGLSNGIWLDRHVSPLPRGGHCGVLTQALQVQSPGALYWAIGSCQYQVHRKWLGIRGSGSSRYIIVPGSDICVLFNDN